MTRKARAVLLFFCCLLLAAGCGKSGETDFVKKYKVDTEGSEDVSEKLQQAIDELEDGGVLFLKEGVYPLKSRIILKENMTLKLDENAVLLNISEEEHPTMMFNHPYKHKEAKGNNNITIDGGIWDMNGQTNEEGEAVNLPNLKSANALCFGYASNIVVKNATFRNCMNGHVMQIAGMDQVTIENCRFEGQWFSGTGNKTRELVQIEPGSLKGYPYTLVQNKIPSTNVTIRNCYFGDNGEGSELMVAIGTHSQQAGVKCSDILIEGCEFQHPQFAAIRFMAYDRITIKNNKFELASDHEEEETYGILADTYGAFLDPSGADSTTELLIEENEFVTDGYGILPICITTNNRSPKRIQNVSIKNNDLTSTKGKIGIKLELIENGVIEGNSFTNFEENILTADCENQIRSDEPVKE